MVFVVSKPDSFALGLTGAPVMHQEYIHSNSFERIGAELATIGVELSDRIPSAWRDIENARPTRGQGRLIRWRNAVELVADLASRRDLLDGRELLQKMVGEEAEIRSTNAREDNFLQDVVYSLGGHKDAFAGKPALRYVLKVGKTTVFADARRKSYDGMLRRYALKEPRLAQLDALAAWIVIKPDNEQVTLNAVGRFLGKLGYAEVGNLKTASTSATYRVRTFQRVEDVGGLALGEEVKVFTIDQFKAAEVDPCSDSARLRYERRRLIEFASRLGFPCTDICVVRHGQTQGNADGVLHGFSSSPLISEVETIARTEGRIFATHSTPPDAIFSSDLARAYDTARLFAAPFDSPIGLRVGLRERHLGAWDGRHRPTSDTNAIFAAYGFLDRIPGGGESFAAMAGRVLSTVQADVDHQAGKSVMLFTHAGPIRALIGGIDGVPPALQWDLPSAPHLMPLSRLIPTGYLIRVFDQLTKAAGTACPMQLNLAA